MSQNNKLFETDEEKEMKKRGYAMMGALGEGSYAIVKGAFSEKLDTKVAAKIINKKKAPKDFLSRFLPREIASMKNLKHPNIVEMFEVIEFGHKVYIMMEYAGHGDLLDYVKLRGALGEPKASEFFLQLTDAVKYIHDENIVHRDLKCENLLLDASNNIKVSDFGFARGFDKGQLSETYCGSAAYAAPEILKGEPYNMPAYDVWSCGVILYIMLNGTMPFDDRNLKKMIKDQMAKKISFSKKVSLTEPAQELVLKILEPEVKKRFTTSDILNHGWIKDAANRRGKKKEDK